MSDSIGSSGASGGPKGLQSLQPGDPAADTLAADHVPAELWSPLASPRLYLKYFLQQPHPGHLERLIPVFHRWIQEDLVKNETPIDVVNYLHVEDGPAVLLILDGGQVSLDVGRRSPGLRYARRRMPDAPPSDRLRPIFRSTLQMMELLEKEPSLPGVFRFDLGRLEFGVTDRLLAPNAAATFDRVKPMLTEFLAELYGINPEAITCEHLLDPRRPFAVDVSLSLEGSPGTIPRLLRDLLTRLENGDSAGRFH